VCRSWWYVSERFAIRLSNAAARQTLAASIPPRREGEQRATTTSASTRLYYCDASAHVRITAHGGERFPRSPAPRGRSIPGTAPAAGLSESVRLRLWPRSPPCWTRRPSHHPPARDIWSAGVQVHHREDYDAGWPRAASGIAAGEAGRLVPTTTRVYRTSRVSHEPALVSARSHSTPWTDSARGFWSVPDEDPARRRRPSLAAGEDPRFCLPHGRMFSSASSILRRPPCFIGRSKSC